MFLRKKISLPLRLLLSSGEIRCLDRIDDFLLESKNLTGYITTQIMPREEPPALASADDELVEIVRDFKAAREALREVTSRLRRHRYREFFQKDTPSLTLSAPSPVQPTATSVPAKDSGGSGSETMKQSESEILEDVPSGMSSISGPIVTSTTLPIVTSTMLEVPIPQYIVFKLITESENKLAQISKLSGADVKLLEHTPRRTENIIQISGTPEQAKTVNRLLDDILLLQF